ncbi:MAG: DNA polymerase Y family protein, partial [Betaproteobacteria bacterium]|nr:DNA polymerase Y family protein [Betaproteobacteria bacterium]
RAPPGRITAMFWLGIHFPLLALEVFLRALPSATGAAPAPPGLAVCRQLRVLHACEQARARGIQPGMKQATALAIAPDLLLREQNPRLEAEAIASAASWALQFTPSVSVQTTPAAGLSPPGAAPAQPCGLLLEVEPSLRLFGGVAALAEQLRTGLKAQGFEPRIAAAPTATGAWLLARHHDGLIADSPASLNARLARLPVSALDSAEAHRDVLASLGADTLRQLSLLPRAGVARRFGPGLLMELDRAFGRVPEAREWFVAPACFTARLELPAQAETADALLAGAARLLIALCGWLNARHAGARSILLGALHDDPPITTVSLSPADPSADPQRLGSLLREKLSVLRLRAPVHTLRLDCESVAPMSAESQTLFPTPTQARESLGRLIEQLQARLGHDRVLRLCLQSDHRPEKAAAMDQAGIDTLVDTRPKPRRPGMAGGKNAGSRGPDSASLRGQPAQGPEAMPADIGALPRPLWLLERPQALGERQQRPWLQGPLTLLAGPERIETGWWDGGLIQRDYFIAGDSDGVLLWIYRERLPGDGQAAGWFLQGRFG